VAPEQASNWLQLRVGVERDIRDGGRVAEADDHQQLDRLVEYLANPQLF
jgi:hypothetical protein